MSRSAKLFIILIRIAVGWYFLYQGIIAILNSSWSILPYIKDAHTFTGFYSYLAHSTLLPYLSYSIKGLFIIIGALLILGIFVRIASLLGALLMLFFYFPLLHFPYVSGTFYIIDEHAVMILLLLYLGAIRAGEFFGLGSMFRFSRY